MFRRINLLLLFLLTIVLSGNHLHAAETPALQFGVFPFKSPKIMMKLFLPVARQLEDTLGRPVHLSTAASAEAFNRRTMTGAYDLIWTCNNCFVKVRKKIHYKAVACGYPSFQGGVIVRKDSNIKEMAQLRGKTIAGVREGSYAGYQFFHNLMTKLGYNHPADYSIKFLGKLDSIIFSVVGKQYDAGVIRVDALDSPRFKQLKNALTVIATSSDIPQFPFAVKPGTGHSLTEQIVTALTAINGETAQGISILKALEIKGIQACTDAPYDDFIKEISDTATKTQELLR